MPQATEVTVIMTPEFIKDLQDQKHPNLAKQVLSHIFEDDGSFKTDRNDHPYKGMTDGHIRWIQMGGAGLRLIYIRKADKVYLYRAVGKSDEDGLKEPKVLKSQSIISELPEDILKDIGESEALIAERILTNSGPIYLREAIRKMYHIPHREIVLISPNVAHALLRRDGELGNFLDRAIEEGTTATLITRPPPLGDIPFFEDLARRNVQVLFAQNLQSRLFLFRVDEYRSHGIKEKLTPVAVLGSAELTHHSLDIGSVGANEELCYRFPVSHFDAFYAYAEKLIKSAIDLQGHKIKLRGV